MPNSAPAGTSLARTVPRSYKLRQADFGFSDGDGNAFEAVIVTTLPGAGTLYYDANGSLGGGLSAVVAGQTISAADILAGKLSYVAPAGASGADYAHFSFQVQDDGGTDAGGVDLDPTPNSLTFDVLDVYSPAAGFPATLDLAALGGNGFKIQGDLAQDLAGWSVSDAGDVNGDGFADIIVGAYGDDGGGAYAGAAYVIFGHATGFGTIDLSTLTAGQGFKIQGEAAGDRAGYSVSAAGDVNGDGFADIILGARENDGGGINAGAAYVIFGHAGGFGTIDLAALTAGQGFKIVGDAAGDRAGFSVSAAGDINGDGFADIILGADRNDGGGTDAGAAYVIFGHAGGFGTIDLGTALTASQGFKIQGDADNDLAGHSVSSAGDINGDGFDDLVVGAYRNDGGGNDAGTAYVIFGHAGGFGTIDLGTPLTASQGFEILGGLDDLAGFSVSAAGDVNGDGIADIVVGAVFDGEGAYNAGAAYVVFGHIGGFGAIDLGAALDPSQGFKILGEADGDLAGWSVSTAGDVNGDGFADIIVGTYRNSNYRGAAYVIFGHAGGFGTIDLAALTHSQGFRIPGEAEYDLAGRSVSAAGDVNGDGFDDIVVSANWNNSGGTHAGAAYVIFGRANSDTAPLLTGFGPSATFAENAVNAAPALLDADVTLTDADGNFNGGHVTVTGLLAEDRIAIFNEGIGAGEIGVSGANVTYGGIVIGSFSGGNGARFDVILNGAATSAAVDALIEHLTYADVSDTPAASRTLNVDVMDGVGHLANMSPAVFTALSGAADPFDGVDVGSFSTPNLVDLDGDGDFDAVVGSVDGTLHLFLNTSGVFTEATGAANPFGAIDIGTYSTPSFADLDGDSDLDLVVGDTNGTLHSFFNDGGVFTEAVGAANPFNGIDVGSHAYPSFADLDGDGDLDLVAGSTSGILRTFFNTGGVFAESAPNPFTGFNFSSLCAPSFADLDGDGDPDLVVGVIGGSMRTFFNTDGVFNEATGAANPFDGTGVADAAAPSLADLDGDGDPDAISGTSNGTLHTFINVASHGASIVVNVTPEADLVPALAELASSVTFAENAVNAAPALLDADVIFTGTFGFAGGRLVASGLLAEDRVAIANEGNGAGQIGVSGTDVSYGGIVIGTFSGGNGNSFTVMLNGSATAPAIEALIEHLTYADVSDTPAASRTLNVDVIDGAGHLANMSPAIFTALSGAADPFDGVDVGTFSTPNLVDLDGDGDFDAVVGSIDGTLHLFLNTSGVFTEATGAANPFGAIDIGTYSTPSFADLDGDSDLDLVVGDTNGTLHSFFNDGGVFTEAVGAANPFNGIDVGSHAYPSFADLDGDGDLDLVAGSTSGILRTFLNAGGVFSEVGGDANPFTNFNFGSLCAPSFADLDGDGDPDLVVGVIGGSMRTFFNTDGVFNEATGAANPFDGTGVADAAGPSLADLDGDGDPDAISGTSDGTLHTFINVASHGAAIIVNVTPGDDDAAVAANDAGSTDESSVIVIDVLANDSDADGPAPAIATVNGAALAAGQSTILASGAKVTLEADGTLTYDPNGRFGTLTNPAGGETGAVNTSAPDSFTYTLAGTGGGTATVSVTVNGVANAADHLDGDGGDNVITGTPAGDYLDLSQGGNDHASGLGGDDGYYFGAAYTNADVVNDSGGTNDQIGLRGDYSGGVTLGTITGIEALVVLPGFSYDITTVDANVAAGGVLNVQATQLAVGQSLTFNGSAETDGAFKIFGGNGDDNLTGGAGNDGFYFGPGGFNSADIVNGGGGINDQLALDGDYTITLGGNVTNVEVLVLLHGPAATPNHFDITTSDAFVAAGQTMTIFGLQVETSILFDGSGELDGAFKIYGGTNADTLTGGSGADWIFGGNGADSLTGGAGNDIFYYDMVGQSTAADGDTILDFATGDKVDVSGIDAIAGGADDAFIYLGSGAFTNHAGELRAVNGGGSTWLVQGDTNGDGVADFQLTLITSDAHPIATGDFTL